MLTKIAKDLNSDVHYCLLMYSLPQEIEVWYIIPALRREYARVLVKKYGLSMQDAGEILGVSKAAVSQYLSKKRAGCFKIPAKIKKEIEKSAGILVKNENLAISEIMRILREIKKIKCGCKLCQKYNKGIIKLCNMKTIY